MPKKVKKPPEKFEALLARLEEIVKKLEDGELDLGEALTVFEEGVSLSRRLNERLNEAEERVEILLRQAQGELKAAPFDLADEKDDDRL